MAPHARGVAVVPVGDHRFLLKRGVTQLLVFGSEAGVASALIGLLDGTREEDEAIAALPEHQQPVARKLLDALNARRLLTREEDSCGHSDPNQRAFYTNFGPVGRTAPGALADAHAVIHGSGVVTRQLVGALLELGLGRVTAVEDPDLRGTPGEWLRDDRLEVLEAAPNELSGVDLLVAADDHGREESLVAVGRRALAAELPFLPVWLADMVGYVGPLTQRYETACLRCYLLRVDSNAKSLEVRRALRANDAHGDAAGFLPPMAAVVAQIAAIQIALQLTGLRLADAVGHSIEISLVSFRSTVRRVLKVPRCPDCGPGNRHGSRVILNGPQITE